MPSFLRSVARSSSTLARPDPWPTSIRGRREKSGVRTSNGVRYERNGAIHKGARLSLHGPETVGNDGSHLFLHPHQMDRWDSCLSAEVCGGKMQGVRQGMQTDLQMSAGHRPDTEDPQGNERDSQLRTCNREMSGHHPGQICTGARHSPVHGVHRCTRRTFKVHTVHFRRCVLCTTNTYK